MRFCAECGAALTERITGGKARPACPACGRVYFEDPKLAVCVLIERGGQLLLGRRGPATREPGKWSFPAGFVDRGERVEDAAAREAREETGLDVRIEGLLGLYSAAGEPVVLAAYAATEIGGALSADDDLTELAFFALDELPPPAFPHDRQIVADWWAWHAQARQEHSAR
jgi:8-oxo-dGTP diphosphatase